MKRNISEELNINDVIMLDDGSEKKEEAEKEAKDHEKYVQDELDKKVDDFEEIKNAEAPKLEVNDGYGKALHIKQFTEKLILSEDDCENILNEEIDTFKFSERDEAVHAVYNSLAKYAKFLYFDLDEDEEDLESFDIFDELESVCEEAMIRLEDGEWAV